MDKLGEGRLEAPEDVCVDGEGTLYTATRDGWIKRMHPNGSWEDWKLLGGSALLGMTVSATGDLLVCDADKVITPFRPSSIPQPMRIGRLLIEFFVPSFRNSR